MKKITFTIMALSLFSIGFIKAQALDTIPNGDFARWNGTTQAKAQPQGWDTLSGISYPVTDVNYFSRQAGTILDSPARYGKYALSLSCEVRNNDLYIGGVSCKFAMTHKDPYLNMSMSYMEGIAPQSPLFEVISWNSTTHDTILKTGILYLSSVTSSAGDTINPWGKISIPLTYTSDGTTADSGAIFIFNAAPSGNPSASVLYIDKIWFDNNPLSGISPELASNSNSVGTYPNPFTSKTTIHYNLAQSGLVNLTVYDMQGKEVQALVNTNQSAGTYNETFDGNGLSNGVYFYKLMTSTGVQTGKLILSK